MTTDCEKCAENERKMLLAERFALASLVQVKKAYWLGWRTGAVFLVLGASFGFGLARWLDV